MGIGSQHELQTHLAHTACPNCSRSDLELRLRCDLGQAECLYLIKCRGCDTHYTVGAQSEALVVETLGLAAQLAVLSCPTCPSGSADLGFQCDLTTRGCYYTFSCKSCARTLKEYR